MRTVLLSVLMAAEYIIGAFVGAEIFPDSVGSVVHCALVIIALISDKNE
jgi:hypothetical protein